MYCLAQSGTGTGTGTGSSPFFNGLLGLPDHMREGCIGGALAVIVLRHTGQWPAMRSSTVCKALR